MFLVFFPSEQILPIRAMQTCLEAKPTPWDPECFGPWGPTVSSNSFCLFQVPTPCLLLAKDAQASAGLTHTHTHAHTHTHTHTWILLSHRKDWNDVICSNIDGPRDYHTKRSKSEKDNYHMISNIMIPLICGTWNVTNETYLRNRGRLTGTENRLWVSRGRGGEDWDQQMQTITYRADKQQVLLYSTGNYIQCPVRNHSRKEYEK